MTIKERPRFGAPRGEAGVTGIEYALLAALLAVVSIGAITAVGNAATAEVETMAAGMSTSVTHWVEVDDGSGGDGTSTTTTTTTTLPPTTTTTTTTTLPPTTTTTMPPEKPIIEATGSSEWKNEDEGTWKAIAMFDNTWGEDVVLTIEIVTTKANGGTGTTTKTLEIGANDGDDIKVTRTYLETEKLWQQQVSVEFRVISVTTKPSEGEGVTYETDQPVVLVKVPEPS